MSLPEKMWEENPLKKFADASFEKPGMYLIALRAHLARGKTLIGDMVQSVADVLPKPGSIQSSEES
jgi:hypothetical protein